MRSEAWSEASSVHTRDEPAHNVKADTQTISYKVWRVAQTAALTHHTMAPVTLLPTVPLMNIDPSDQRRTSDTGGVRALAHADAPGFATLSGMPVRYPNTMHMVRVGVGDTALIRENTYLGVRTGDVLLVDRMLPPVVGRLVLAVQGGEIGLCRYIEHEGGRFLVSGVRGEDPIEVVPEHGVRIWGVVSALCRGM